MKPMMNFPRVHGHQRLSIAMSIVAVLCTAGCEAPAPLTISQDVVRAEAPSFEGLSSGGGMLWVGEFRAFTEGPDGKIWRDVSGCQSQDSLWTFKWVVNPQSGLLEAVNFKTMAYIGCPPVLSLYNGGEVYAYAILDTSRVPLGQMPAMPTSAMEMYVSANLYSAGMQVELRADVYPGYQFTGWSESLGGNVISWSNPDTLPLSSYSVVLRASGAGGGGGDDDDEECPPWIIIC